MFDCANVEMRELLPELAAGTLDALTRARVEAHLASCAECASELEMLRLVRAAFAGAPGVDTQRIVAALPKPGVTAAPTRAASAPGVRGSAPPVRRWIDWRIAAALTAITVGGLSLAVTDRMRAARDDGSASSQRASVTDSGTRGPSGLLARGTDSGRSTDTGRAAPAPRLGTGPTRTQLSFGGGVDDLDEASIEALLGALEDIDRAPVAPSVEPDRSPVLPVIREGGDR